MMGVGKITWGGSVVEMYGTNTKQYCMYVYEDKIVTLTTVFSIYKTISTLSRGGYHFSNHTMVLL